MERADELVARYIVDQYRSEHAKAFGGGYDNHLAGCEPIQVIHPEASDGVYGCDTGCEYVRFEATLRCAHGESEDYEYGTFGQLHYIIEDMERDERGGYGS